MNRILIIEDDPSGAEIITRMCVAGGIKPKEFKIVNNLAEGVRLANQEPPDLIVLDLTLPPATSENACIRDGIGPLSLKAPLVVLTGSATPDIVIKCHTAGAQACILKQNALMGRCGVELLAQVIIQATLNWKREHGRR